MTENSDGKLSVSRRKLLNYSWRLAGLLALGEAGYVGLRYLDSRQPEGAFGSVITAGRIDDFLPGSITPFEQARFYLVRMPDGGFIALYTKCTHLACIVSWDANRGHFFCPCHGSEFDRNGDVDNPPAPRPLDRFPITLEKNRVKVDTGKPIQRKKASPDDFVYDVEA